MEPVEATKLTVYIGDSFRYRHRPLYRAIVEMGLGFPRFHGLSAFKPQLLLSV